MTARADVDAAASKDIASIDFDAWRRNIRNDASAHYHFNMGLGIERIDGNPSAAADAYRRALAIAPGMVEISYCLARALTAAGRAAEAADAEQAARAAEPDYPAEALYRLGVRLYEMGDGKRALEHLLAALSANPEHQAARVYAHLVQIGPGKPWPAGGDPHPDGLSPAVLENLSHEYCRIGRHLREHEDLQGSRRAFAMATVLDARNGDAHVRLGMVLQKLGDADGAEVALRTGIELEGPQLAHLVQLAAVYQARCELDEAEATVRRGIAANGKSIGALGRLGSTLHAQGRLTEAIALYEEAMEMAETKDLTSWLFSCIALSLLNMGEVSRAETAAKRGLDEGRGILWEKKGATYLGLVKHAQGHLEDAVTLHRMTVKEVPGEAFGFLNLAAALQALGRVEDAAAAYKSACEVQSGWVPYNKLQLPEWARALLSDVEKQAAADGPDRVE